MIKHVWISTSFCHTDFPRIERFELLAEMPSGVKVRQHGSVRLIRQATERKFFFKEEDAEKWVRAFLTRRAESCRNILERLERALAGGTVLGSFYTEIAGERPPWMDRKAKLDDS